MPVTVAVCLGYYLLLCKWLPLTLVIDQHLIKDGSVVSVQLTRVTDMAKQVSHLGVSVTGTKQ